MKKGLDAYKLKLIALLFMITDHVYSYLNAPVHGYQAGASWPQWIPVLTRFVSPLFLYLMIDGFYHTSSRKKFLIRIFVAAMIMGAGNAVINLLFHNVNPATGKYSFRSIVAGHNIFLTLAALFAIVWCLEKIRQRKNIVLNCVLTFILALSCLFFEGGFYLLPVAVIVWLFHKSKALQCIGISAWSGALLLHTIISYHSGNTGTDLYSHLCFDNEWAMFAVIFFILLYNGERGRNTALSKYMFYIIYPVHLWILMIIRFCITN